MDFSVKRRVFLMSSSFATISALAQSKTSVFAVNEPVSYGAYNAESSDRYAAMMSELSRKQSAAFKMEKVPNYADLDAGLKAGRYDLALVHPSHVAMAALQTGQYRLVAVSRAHINYKAYFLTRSDSTVKTLTQLTGRSLLMPDENSVTSWLARATLAEALPAGSRPTVRSVRFQDAVRMAVENKMADVGVTASPSEVKEWQAAGHSVLATSRSAPVKIVLVHKRLEAQLDTLRTFFEGQLDTGKIGIPEGFVGFDEAVLLKVWEWLRRGAPTAA
jgi:phosphonate transport system substrate-binding protein